ncbi:MAG TPA: Fur family transcriptional regulator [Anaerolineales bacterium]|nr:Fur family transcriptional regulator [Anaerolineales bacterium]
MEEVLAQFREFLHALSLRATDVRLGILRAILAREGHFDIDELVTDLRAQGMEASRATVYCALPLFAEAGFVQSTLKSGDRRCYESTIGHDHHDHLLCTTCGKVVDFQFETFEILQREAASKNGFTLTGHSHELFGLCRDCERGARH